MSLKTTTVKVAITRDDEGSYLDNPIFNTIHIGPDDEAAGSFLCVERIDDDPGKITLNWDEWDAIVKVVAKHRKEWDWEG